MRQLLIMITFLVLAWSCTKVGTDPKSTRGTDTSNNYNDPLVGRWTEHWAYAEGESGNVTYVDTLMISKVETNYVITCINQSNYIYDNIYLDKEELTFRMEHTTASTENQPFYVFYTLKLSNRGDRLEGHIINSLQQTNDVTCVKLPLM